MESEHREHRREVIDSITPAEPAGHYVETTQETVYAPYTERRETVAKVVQGIYLLFGVVEAIIAIRFALMLLGANPASPFAAFMYGISAPFVAPFRGLFAQTEAGASLVEWHSLVAILVYALVAGLLAKVVWLLFADDRYGVHRSHTHSVH